MGARGEGAGDDMSRPHPVTVGHGTAGRAEPAGLPRDAGVTSVVDVRMPPPAAAATRPAAGPVGPVDARGGPRPPGGGSGVWAASASRAPDSPDAPGARLRADDLLVHGSEEEAAAKWAAPASGRS